MQTRTSRPKEDEQVAAGALLLLRRSILGKGGLDQKIWTTSDICDKFLGVSQCPRGNGWVARITVDGLAVNLGTFATKEEAAHSYDQAVRQRRLARPMNFPQQVPAARAPAAPQVPSNKEKSSPPRRYVGVYAKGARWEAQVMVASKARYIGRFDTKEAAAKAYDKFVLEHALLKPLNFPLVESPPTTVVSETVPEPPPPQQQPVVQQQQQQQQQPSPSPPPQQQQMQLQQQPSPPPQQVQHQQMHHVIIQQQQPHLQPLRLVPPTPPPLQLPMMQLQMPMMSSPQQMQMAPQFMQQQDMISSPTLSPISTTGWHSVGLTMSPNDKSCRMLSPQSVNPKRQRVIEGGFPGCGGGGGGNGASGNVSP